MLPAPYPTPPRLLGGASLTEGSVRWRGAAVKNGVVRGGARPNSQTATPTLPSTASLSMHPSLFESMYHTAWLSLWVDLLAC